MGGEESSADAARWLLAGVPESPRMRAARRLLSVPQARGRTAARVRGPVAGDRPVHIQDLMTSDEISSTLAAICRPRECSIAGHAPSAVALAT